MGTTNLNKPILEPYHDHGYRVVTLRPTKAVFNHKYFEWGEYVGDDYLEEGDEVIEVLVCE